MYEKALEDKRKSDLMEQTAEEHTLTREQNKMYREGQLEIGRQNAAAHATAAEGAADQRTAKAEEIRANAEPATPAYLKAIGREDLIGSGITMGELNGRQAVSAMRPKPPAWKQVDFNGKKQWIDLNANKDLANQGAFGVIEKPGFIYKVGDDGTVTEIQKGAPAGTKPKVVAPAGTGKTGGGSGSGGKGGSEKAFQHEWNRSREQLIAEGNKAPTNEQIAAKKVSMFPGKLPAAAARDPRAAKPAYKTGELKKYISDAADREKAKDRIRQAKEAGYSRQEVEEALKGTPWQ
jgi:hypothetical protein